MYDNGRLSGTASSASDGASGAVTPMLSAARQRTRRSRSQAAKAAIMNGIFQPLRQAKSWKGEWDVT
jgi:hypothetical protein